MSTQVRPEQSGMRPAVAYGRRRPLVALAFSALVLALHHLWAVTQGSVYPTLVWLFGALGAISAAGVLYPPIFFTMSSQGKPLPLYLKVLAGLIALAGAACGFYFAEVIYHPGLPT